MLALDQRLGVLCLGVFVGFLLGFGLTRSKPTLRAALTVVGAALGGAPVAFLTTVQYRWLYPIGLLTGLIWVRIANIRIAADTRSHTYNLHAHTRLAAWVDVALIILVSVAVIYAVIAPPGQVIEQHGELQLTGTGEYEVFYPQPFVSAPALTFPSGADKPQEFWVVEQRANGFKVAARGTVIVGTIIKWSAKGQPK